MYLVADKPKRAVLDGEGFRLSENGPRRIIELEVCVRYAEVTFSSIRTDTSVLSTSNSEGSSQKANVMELDLTWAGPPIDDPQTLRKLPSDLAQLLTSVNGFIQFSGALHVRGVCKAPAWHSLNHAWNSPDAFLDHYQSVKKADVPFAQSALGDQYLLRDNFVYRLDTECDEIESLDMNLNTFLEEVQGDPIGVLNLEPLEEFWGLGGELQPGQLLSVMPPFVVAQPNSKYSYRAISTLDRLRFLADFAKQIRDLPDGASISFKIDH